MKRNSQLSGVLHALLHMAERGEPMTSEDLAACLDTNPVVVRRTMAGLREAGIVASERGHGGGWTLTRGLADIRLRDVHTALGEPGLFQIGTRNEHATCLLERSVNVSLGQAFQEAEALLLQRLASVTLDTLAADVRDRLQACKETRNAS